MENEALFSIKNSDVSAVFGQFDRNVKKIEKEFNVKIVNRGDYIKVKGDDVTGAVKTVECLIKAAENNIDITEQSLNYTIESIKDNNEKDAEDINGELICVTVNGRPVRAKTTGQKKYADAIKKNTVVFGVGPAGTGKTYIAMALAINAFKNNEVNRIILTRPAIEAGEKLGFLPGDLQQKVDPYLRPLYDALYDIMGADSFVKNMEKGLIEVAPLAYMRGRTLDNAFIVLDEAQNTTPEQMKMFLTRIGYDSKAVITGDITQIDLSDGKRSGLKEAVQILDNIEDIKIITLTNRDVVRHPLVQKIILAYEKHEQHLQKKQNAVNGAKKRK